jgi:hypothetical protein
LVAALAANAGTNLPQATVAVKALQPLEVRKSEDLDNTWCVVPQVLKQRALPGRLYSMRWRARDPRYTQGCI